MVARRIMSHLIADMKNMSDVSELFQPYVHFWMNFEMNLGIQKHPNDQYLEIKLYLISHSVLIKVLMSLNENS